MTRHRKRDAGCADRERGVIITSKGLRSLTLSGAVRIEWYAR